jgi:hypothetical protein
MNCKRANCFLAMILSALIPWVEAAEETTAETANSAVTNAEGLEEPVLIQADGNNESDSELQNREGDDDFIPSTQISEDLSVSFPVDI